MKNFLRHAYAAPRRLAKVPRDTEKILINQGAILAKLNSSHNYADLRHYEFKVFSQWGEDGIIQRLTQTIPEVPRTFIEFGVEDFSESNCRFLMMKDNWSGYIIDGSARNVATIRTQDYYWKYDLTAVHAFITRDNIADLLRSSHFGLEPGILSIDIDGVDYHVLEALAEWRPYIVIVEFNGHFGWERPLSVPYDPAFTRSAKHFSNVYWGANLPAFHHLLEGRGYELVGVNSVGSNAFFVREDQVPEGLNPLGPSACRRPVTFREARDEGGRLTFQSEAERVRNIAHLPLIDVVSGEIVTLRDLAQENNGGRNPA